MKINDELISTWRQSIIQIRDGKSWPIIWDGAHYYREALPKDLQSSYFYVITAYNPGGEPLSEPDNVGRNKELGRRLDSLVNVGAFESVGKSLSGSHAEYGYAVFRAEKILIDQLANECGQIGYYRFTFETMEIFVKGEDGVFVLI